MNRARRSSARKAVGPVRIPKAAEIVAEHLRRRIVRRELREGDALPPEAELIEQFGVSRPTLREAVRILESESLISVTRGARGGARVHTPDAAVLARYFGLLLQTDGVMLADVHDVQMILEPAAVRLLAEQADRDAVAELRRCIERESLTLTSPEVFSELGGHFHRVIFDLTGNRALGLLAGLVHDIFEMHVACAARRTGNPDPTQMGRAIRAHEKAVELIEKGKAEEAERFWRTHLEAVGRVLKKSYGARSVVDLFE